MAKKGDGIQVGVGVGGGMNLPSLSCTLSLSLSLRLGALDRSCHTYVSACQASLIWAVYLGPALALGRSSLGVRPIDKKPHQSPCLPSGHSHALRDAPGGLLALPEARPWSSQVDAHPLASRLVATVKLCYTPCQASRVVCLATSRKVGISHNSSGPFVVGAVASHKRHCRGCTSTSRGTQCELGVRLTRRMRSRTPSQATPNSSPSRNPSKKHELRPRAASILSFSHLNVRRQTAPQALALPGLACAMRSGTGVSAVRTSWAGAEARLPRELGPQLCRLATVPRVPRTGWLWLNHVDAVPLFAGENRLSTCSIPVLSITYRSQASRGCLYARQGCPNHPRPLHIA